MNTLKLFYQIINVYVLYTRTYVVHNNKFVHNIFYYNMFTNVLHRRSDPFYLLILINNEWSRPPTMTITATPPKNVSDAVHAAGSAAPMCTPK